MVAESRRPRSLAAWHHDGARPSEACDPAASFDGVYSALERN